MSLFQKWSWQTEWEDFSVQGYADKLHWSSENAYYPGKPAFPSVKQTLADFLAHGAPEDYMSLPKNLRQEIQDWAKSQSSKPV